MHTIERDINGTFTIHKDFNPPISLSFGEEYTYYIDKIRDLENFTKFSDTIDNLNNTRTVKRYWRIGFDECKWSDWQSTPLFNTKSSESDSEGGFKAGIYPLYKIEEVLRGSMFDEFPELDSAIDYHLELKWVRTGSNQDGDIILHDFTLEGNWNRNVLSDPYAILGESSARVPVIIRPNDILKVFRLDDFETIISGETSNKKLNIEYRISQDNWRTSTQWEELTTENISTSMKNHRLSPIRFFHIEYKVTRVGSDVTGGIKLYDINLIGEFQNVSEDYTKSNLVGIRECCKSGNSTNLAIYEGNGIPGFIKSGEENTIKTNSGSDGECLPDNLANPMGSQELANLWDPYNLKKATDLYNSISNSTNEMFGWEVVYFLTDPDIKGTDHTFHEHQLKNVVDENTVKVSVDDNQFPDNQISFNQFDLSLFETFEIHLTKDVFKRTFGVDKRPSKHDFLWFCELNRMYQVEHAQPFRDFMNAGVYYKVILKKYTQKSSIQPANETIANRIEELTQNTTLNELFGLEMENDKKEVAQKDQHSTLSKDKIRFDFSAKIVRELIENASLVINKYHYDLSDIKSDDTAIRYSKPDTYVRESDNRSYSAWFKIPEYVVNERHNFIDNYKNGKGYKIDLLNNGFHLTFNDNIYSMPLTTIGDNVWYCYTININQRQRKVEQFLYKRNVTNESDARKLNKANLELVTSREEDFTIGEFEFDNGNDIIIQGSNMRLTNIRIYNDIVEESSHNKILNQYIIRDTDYLILGDNSNKKVRLDNYPYN